MTFRQPKDRRPETENEDRGHDLFEGDVVWVKGIITGPPNYCGDVGVRFLPRPGKKEYARPSVNAIFLRRSRFASLRRILRRIRENGVRLVRVPRHGTLAVGRPGFYCFRWEWELVAVGFRLPFTTLDLRLWWGGKS